MPDSGDILMAVSASCLGRTFYAENPFRSRQGGQAEAAALAAAAAGEAQSLLERLDRLAGIAGADETEPAGQMPESAIAGLDRAAPESVRKAADCILAVKNRRAPGCAESTSGMSAG